MQSRFIDFIRCNNLISANDKILLGVSGGIDSMVMLYLFRKAGFNVAVAHCNFSLRGEESNGDEQLVIHECEINRIKLHRIKFETRSFAEEHKLSIQVSARNLRYQWFNKLCDEFGYTKIAIAHNRDDVAETVILNLTRGTGLKGLSGIKVMKGNVIRPLLFAGRDEIAKYAIHKSVLFREDSSNSSIKYARNRIRHNVLPELEKLNPSAKSSIAETAKHVHEAWNLVEDYLVNLKDKLEKKETDRILFDIQGLKDERYSKLFLFEELGSFGFTHETLDQVVASIYGQPGKIFYSSSHQLLRDREFFILTKKRETDQSIVLIDDDCSSLDYPIKLRFSLVERSESFEIPHDNCIAVLDFEKISFPIKLRTWQPGDKFMPFGMDKFKKVSDYLIDQKVSLLEKENVFILESGDNVVWLVGYRIDNRFKVANQTTKFFVIEYL
jgi:tRNA(Ile)-lysidine synthase